MEAKAVDSYACSDCPREFMPMFMLEDEVWWTVLKEEERAKQFDLDTKKGLCTHDKNHRRVAICLRCCSRRLDRPLCPSDFMANYLTSSMLGAAAEVVRPELADPGCQRP